MVLLLLFVLCFSMPPKRAASGRVAELTKRLRPGSRKSGAGNEESTTRDSISIDSIEAKITSNILDKVAQVVRDTMKEQHQSLPPPPAPSPSVANPSVGESVASLVVDQSVSSSVGHITGITVPSAHTTANVTSIPIGQISQYAPPSQPIHTISTPVANQVSAKIRSKIWSNEFIKLSLLLDESDDQDESFSLQLHQSGGVPTLRWCATESKKQLTMNQWLKSWNRFSALFIQQYPQHSTGLAKHFETVRQVFSKNGDWHRYDESYRREISESRITWGCPHLELYLEALTTKGTSAILGNFSTGNATSTNNSGRDNSGRGTGRLPKGVCYKHHTGQVCSKGANCKFQHACFNCNAPHPITQCTQPMKRPFRVHSRFTGSANASTPPTDKQQSGKSKPTFRPNVPTNAGP
jgi:hypothetical protein